MGGYVARKGNRETSTNFCLESLRGRDHSEDLNVDGSIILKRNLGK
jgi:hypothetical protein